MPAQLPADRRATRPWRRTGRPPRVLATFRGQIAELHQPGRISRALLARNFAADRQRRFEQRLRRVELLELLVSACRAIQNLVVLLRIGRANGGVDLRAARASSAPAARRTARPARPPAPPPPAAPDRLAEPRGRCPHRESPAAVLRAATAGPWRPRPHAVARADCIDRATSSRWPAYSDARAPACNTRSSAARSRSLTNSRHAIHASGFHQCRLNAVRASRCVATSPRRTCASSCSSTMRRRSSGPLAGIGGQEDYGTKHAEHHRHAAGAPLRRTVNSIVRIRRSSERLRGAPLAPHRAVCDQHLQTSPGPRRAPRYPDDHRPRRGQAGARRPARIAPRRARPPPNGASDAHRRKYAEDHTARRAQIDDARRNAQRRQARWTETAAPAPPPRPRSIPGAAPPRTAAAAASSPAMPRPAPPCPSAPCREESAFIYLPSRLAFSIISDIRSNSSRVSLVDETSSSAATVCSGEPAKNVSIRCFTAERLAFSRATVGR